MLKATSFIPKTLHSVYSALLMAVAVIIYGAGAFLLVLGALAVILFAIVGFALALAVTFLLSLPNRLFLRWASAADPEYRQNQQDKFQEALGKLAKSVDDVNPGGGDLSAIMKAATGDKS
jgi:membrane protein implicated in regulation of membrane protease activity